MATFPRCNIVCYRYASLFACILLCFSECLCANFTHEESLRLCKEFLETNPKSFDMNIYYRKDSRSHLGNFKTSSGKFNLDNYVKFHLISSVAEERGISSVCIAFEDTTSYTRLSTNPGKDYGVQVRLSTKVEVPVGIINVSRSCWWDTRFLGNCNPVFMPMPGLLQSALYVHSPLSEEFWDYLQEDTVFRKQWIWAITLFSSYDIGNIQASWVSRVNLSSLTKLEIFNNDWQHPDALIGSLPNLEFLSIPFNKIKILPSGMFEGTPKLQELNLGVNPLLKLPEGIEKLTRIRSIYLEQIGGTLSISDEEISTLGNVSNLNMYKTRLQANITKLMSLPNLQKIHMSESYVGNFAFGFDTPLIQISPLTYVDLSFNSLTQFPTNVFWIMSNLSELRLNDNHFKICPNNTFKSLISLQILNLARNGLTNLHHDCFFGAKKLTELDLSWNNLTFLEPLTLRSNIHIQELKLNHNSLMTVNNQVLLPLINIKNVDLSFNHLIQIPTFGGNELDSLILSNNDLTFVLDLTLSTRSIRDLDLSHNRIHELKLDNVRNLTLSYNSLTHISSEMWESLSRINFLDLGGNHFNCCHDDTVLLQRKINSLQNSLREGRSLTCFINDKEEVLLETFQYNSSICLEEYKSAQSAYIEIGLGVFFVIAVVVLISVLLYFYRTELTYIKYLFVSKTQGCKNDDERYKNCTYDAFVCYSGKNYTWVMDKLVRSIEGGSEGYRLCIHNRDFTLGAAIDTNVVACLEKSRKVILVLSQDFIESRWCQFEVGMANHKMLTENLAYIIIIEVERLDKKDVPRNLRYLIDSRTYLEWPEDTSDEQKVLRCWDRLRQALGDSIFRRTGRTVEKCSVLHL